MTQTQQLILAAILTYFAAMIIIGLLASRNQDHQGFVIGHRSVGYIPTMATLSAGFRDGMGLVFWVGFGALSGYGGLWMLLGLIIGMCFYSFVGPKVRDYAEKHDYITIGEIIRARLGVNTERLTALYIVIFALIYIAVQLYVSGNLFAKVLGMEPYIGVCSVAAIVGMYLFFGGYSTVVKTDAVQFFLILSLIALPIFFTPSTEDVLAFGTLFSPTFLDISAFFLLGLFFPLSSADIWQRVFSARDKKVIQYSFPLSGVMLVIMTLSLIYLGMAAKPYIDASWNNDQILFSLFEGDFIAAPLLAFIAVVFMAISMSTLDTNCYLLGSTLAKNFVPNSITADRDSYIRFTRIVFILILVSMSFLALSITDVVKFLFDCVGILFVLVPVYIYTALGLFSKSRTMDMMVSASIFISGALYLYMILGAHIEQFIMSMIPVGVSIALCTLCVIAGRFLPNDQTTVVD